VTVLEDTIAVEGGTLVDLIATLIVIFAFVHFTISFELSDRNAGIRFDCQLPVDSRDDGIVSWLAT
jgi:hypothetical protein